MIRALVCLAVLTLVSGCGIRGGLERPPPMWGEERQRYEAEQAAERAREEAERAREEEQERQVTPGSVEPSGAQPPASPTDVTP